MGQKYRFDPVTHQCTYQEPSAAQVELLQRLKKDGDLSVEYIGGRTTYAACIERGWAVEIRDRTLALTDVGRAELTHQQERAVFADKHGLVNSPRLAKLMHSDD